MKRVNDHLRDELGVKYVSLDSDGNFLALTVWFLVSLMRRRQIRDSSNLGKTAHEQ